MPGFGLGAGLRLGNGGLGGAGGSSYAPTDLGAALESAVRLGGKVLLHPVESAPGHWVAIVADPSGAKIALTRIDRQAQ